MPFRLDDRYGFRAKIQFTTSAQMPSQIYRACLRTNTVSNTVYIQRAVAEALSRDLGIPLQEILDQLPEPRGVAKRVCDPEEHPMRRTVLTAGRIGPANTVEEVR